MLIRKRSSGLCSSTVEGGSKREGEGKSACSVTLAKILIETFISLIQFSIGCIRNVLVLYKLVEKCISLIQICISFKFFSIRMYQSNTDKAISLQALIGLVEH